MIKLIARILVLIFIIGLILAIFAPTIISTNFGKNAFFKSLRSITGYEIRSETLKLQWMNGQSLTHVEVLDKAGNAVFKADEITSTASLWKICIYHDVGHLTVENPSVVIEPPQKLLSKLTVHHAGFVFAVTLVPTKHVLGEISVKNGTAQFISPGLEPIFMKEIALDANLLPQQIKIVGGGVTEEKGAPGMLQGTFQVDLLAYPGSDQIDANLKLTNFPLRAADQIVSILYPNLKGVIQDTIGESFNANVKLKNLRDDLELFVNAESERFSANLQTKLQGDTLVLASPATLHMELTSQAFEKLTSLPIQKGVATQLKIDQLSIPLLDRNKIALQGTLRADAIQFSNWTIDPFTLFVGNSQTVPGEWNVKIDSPQVQFQGSLNLPEKLDDLTFNGQALLPKNTKLDIKTESLQSIVVVVQGDLWKGRFKGAFDPAKKTIALKETGYLTVEFPQFPAPLPPLLKEPLPVQFTLDPTTVDLVSMRGSIKGAAKTPPFQMGSSQAGATTVQFTGDIRTKQAQFSLTSSIDNSPLSAEGTYNSPQDIKLSGSCDKLPVASVQPFLTNGPQLLPLIGDSLTTQFQVELTANSNFLKINTVSPLLQLTATLKGTSETLELIQPANFLWTVTPEGYSNLATWLKGSALYSLAQPATLKGAISTFSVNFNQIAESVVYDANLTADGVAFSNTSIPQILIHLSHPKPSTPHAFQVSASADTQGKLLCQGSFTPPGTADIKLLIQQFPSATFDLLTSPFLGNQFSLATLCGPVINLTGNTTLNQWNGPCSYELHSANLRSSLQGNIKEGTLGLVQPFQLQLSITPQISAMLARMSNAKDATSYRSEGPVTFVIQPQGFSYPIEQPDLSKIQIGAARLELGKLLCRNQGNIQSTLGLLKSGQYRPGDEVELWFAPCDFTASNGVINYERTEILFAKDFQVCTWGDVDLPQDYVDATLGLTASCLKRAFGIPNLPKNYVLQIPVRGPLSNIEVDKGKATSKIGALMLWQQKGDIAGGFLKGPAGKFLGQTLDKLGPLPGGDDKAPPAKRPFPWEQEDDARQQTSDAKHIDPTDSPLKQVLKLVR